jgi:hypothetical protein
MSWEDEMTNSAWVERIESFLRRNELDEAERHVQSVLAIDPQNQSAQDYLQQIARHRSAPPSDARGNRIEVERAKRKLAGHEEYLNALQRFPAPYIGHTGKPFAPCSDDLQFDQWGFLNFRLPEMPKKEDVVRIFVVGDSTMCRGRDLDHTVPALARTELHRRGLTQVEVFNFSVISSRTAQMLSLMFNMLNDFDPDLIVCLCGAAEIYVPVTYDPRPGYPYNFYVLEELYSRFFDPARSESRDIVTRDDLFQGIAERQAALRAETGVGSSDDWESKAAEEFGWTLMRMNRFATAYAVDIALLLQPTVGTKAQLTANEAALLRPEMLEYFKRQYDRFRTASGLQKGMSTRVGSHMVLYDTTVTFDEIDLELYEDFVHYNAHGNVAIAHQIADIITTQLSLN